MSAMDITSEICSPQTIPIQNIAPYGDGHTAAATQGMILDQRELKNTASEGIFMDDIEHNIIEQTQAQVIDAAPAQTSLQAGPQVRCEQCIGKRSVCDGDQERGQGCTACTKRKGQCSFIPRNCRCRFCPKRYTSQTSLRRHNSIVHKTKVHDSTVPKPLIENTTVSVSVQQLPHRSFHSTVEERAPPMAVLPSSSQLEMISEQLQRLTNAPRPSPRAVQPAKRRSLETTDRPRNRSCVAEESLSMETSQPAMATEENEELNPQGHREIPGIVSRLIEQDALYQPDSPPYEPTHNALDSRSVHNLPVEQLPPEASTASRSHEILSLQNRNPPIQDGIITVSNQGSTLHLRQRRRAQSDDMPAQGPTLNADIYFQFQNRVMSDNHVESKLGVIRDEIKLYEEFTRGADYHYTDQQVEEEFKFLETVKPFLSIREVQEEPNRFFAIQTSRLVVLWRAMFDIHPTALLHDELVRLDLENLELPVIIRGSLSYILLRTIFDEHDQLKSAERRARLKSVQRLYGARFAAESIKHDELSINEDKNVDRALRKPARDLAEQQFYELCYPLTHWDIRNPTAKMKDIHIRKLTDITLKCLLLSREFQARITENYSYFWPRPGELFNHDDHQDADTDQTRSQSVRIIKWTLMFGVKARRDTQQQLVYAKAVVITIEA